MPRKRINRSLNETVQVTCQHFVPWPQSNTMSLRAQALLSCMCTSAAHCVTSGFRHEVYENCLLLGYCAVSSGNSLKTFRDNLSAPYSRLKNPSGSLQMRPVFYILFEIKLIPTFSGFGFGEWPGASSGSYLVVVLHVTDRCTALKLHIQGFKTSIGINIDSMAEHKTTKWSRLLLRTGNLLLWPLHNITFIITIAVIYMITTLVQGSWPLKMGAIDCFETSVRNCYYSLRDIPWERSYQFQICFKHFYRPFRYG